VLYYAALYLKSLGLSQVDIGKLLWIPPLGWEAGYFFWGWWTDRTVARRGFTTASYRRLFALLTAASLPLAAVTLIASVPALMAALWFAMFVAAGFIVVSVSYATTAFGTADSGLLAGLGAGSWSALVAILMPAAGWLFDRHLYAAAFALAAAFPPAGLACWLVLNRNSKALAAADC
jgi:MFS transporter, ACS family, hexuronate transporter